MPAPHSRRLWTWLIARPILAVVLFLQIIAVLGWILQSQSAARLQETVAELDAADPTWRIEALEAKRASVGDAENGALIVIRANEHMPKTWPEPAERLKHPTPSDQDAPIRLRLPVERNDLGPRPPESFDYNYGEPKAIDQKVLPLPANARLRPDLTEELRDQLAKVDRALGEARRLKDYPRGRFPIVYAADGISTRVDQQQSIRRAVHVLALHAFLMQEQGKFDDALDDCRAMLNAARAIGDEPLLVCQLIRVAGTAQAIESLQRTLAQGAPSPSALLSLQQLLEVFLIAARGDRGLFDRGFQKVEGDLIATYRELQFYNSCCLFSLSGPSLPPRANDCGWPVQDGLDTLTFQADHALFLQHMTKVIEIAQLAPEQWEVPLANLDSQTGPRAGPLSRILLDSVRKMARGVQRGKAQIRCAIIALAAERYRQENHRWPESVDALVEAKLLSAVPLDPFTGEPLRYVERKGHRIVYSFGQDRFDNDGAVYHWNRGLQNVDFGFLLFNVEQRGQSPVEFLHAPREAAPTDPWR